MAGIVARLVEGLDVVDAGVARLAVWFGFRRECELLDAVDGPACWGWGAGAARLAIWLGFRRECELDVVDGPACGGWNTGVPVRGLGSVVRLGLGKELDRRELLLGRCELLPVLSWCEPLKGVDGPASGWRLGAGA